MISSHAMRALFRILWAFINPVFTVLIYWLVFGFGLKAAMTDGKYPFIVYLITGMVPWFFFSDAFTSTTLVLGVYVFSEKSSVQYPHFAND